MALILGLDGGATKTGVMVLDTGTDKIIESVSGSSNYLNVGIEVAKNNIVKPVLDIVEEIKESKCLEKIFFASSCFGFSGCDLDSDLKTYKEIIFTSELDSFLDQDKALICNDTKIGLAAGSNNKNRIMIICGTGSNCYGINESGEEARSNGWDYILGDEGSGYSIAIKALRAIMRAYDGRGGKTILSENVLKYLGFSSEIELVRWAYENTISKNEIATVASIVCKTAYADDQISIKILKEECDEAILTVTTLINKLKLKNSNFDLVLVGSVFNCKKYFKDLLVNQIKKHFSGVNIKNLVKKPAEGAIKLALENLNKKTNTKGEH